MSGGGGHSQIGTTCQIINFESAGTCGGANENMNGLIREIFQKKMRFDSITKKDISAAMHYLNHRPRKCLGFKTPHEVFWKKLHFRLNAVALQS